MYIYTNCPGDSLARFLGAGKLDAPRCLAEPAPGRSSGVVVKWRLERLAAPGGRGRGGPAACSKYCAGKKPGGQKRGPGQSLESQSGSQDEEEVQAPNWGVGTPCVLMVRSATWPYALKSLMEPVMSFERKPEAASLEAMGSYPLNAEARITPAYPGEEDAAEGGLLAGGWP
ncbi:hypothetical protein Aspvir_009109 [Aspergillus viridinutans]|uniref:Uncharacterized protein n=1 Tax=Aspergillus viridinutans TaxID=75553 RepID=A0A9P3BZA4_ASPVI|nr:uncharacterized protein Aspvir_009109 [Aspergillus viridinutans]GIK05010.1 hypothetical protein Aspvir_009109 [Aspergillus viridinutans]